MSKDYYSILGVQPDANEQEIKAAYRKLALQWHPDRHPQGKEEAEQKFKDINEAYQVLGDKNQRERYDQLSESPTPSPMPFRFFNPEEIFANFFRSSFFSPFGSTFGSFSSIFEDNFSTRRSFFPFSGFPQPFARTTTFQHNFWSSDEESNEFPPRSPSPPPFLSRDQTSTSIPIISKKTETKIPEEGTTFVPKRKEYPIRSRKKFSISKEKKPYHMPRKKKGCSCGKSTGYGCMDKKCSCRKHEVGCSVDCHCLGCRNPIKKRYTTDRRR